MATVSVPIPIQYYQFDQQGVVFNMWYLALMEQARNAYLAEFGFSLQDLHASGHDIQVVHVEVDWLAPLRYGDQLTIDVSPGRVGTTSFGLKFEFIGDQGTIATADAVYVIVDDQICGKADLPPGLRSAVSQ